MSCWAGCGGAAASAGGLLAVLLLVLLVLVFAYMLPLILLSFTGRVMVLRCDLANPHSALLVPLVIGASLSPPLVCPRHLTASCFPPFWAAFCRTAAQLYPSAWFWTHCSSWASCACLTLCVLP